ncbi:MAG: acetoacetate decarboxylase family protein [Actinomycetota bacterium]|nr:acetoacetate decarboxylase family protein [Actinomycetota bacterium]
MSEITSPDPGGAAPDYPPEPWVLHGQLRTSVFAVPLTDIPVDLPPGCHPVRIGRYGVVGTAWVSYESSGVLAYEELMSTVLVRRGWRLMPTISHIWVDSPTSLAGGRALWGIPKELATFETSGQRRAARDEVGPLADAELGRVRWLPGRWPVSFTVVQWLHGAAKQSPVRTRARVGVARERLRAETTGPLAFLAGRRPLLSLALGDFRMRFGG